MTEFDLRQQRTRDSLRSALMALVAESPFEAISITDITRRARVARKTFYAHYNDKDALLLDCVLPMLSAAAQTVTQMNADTLLAGNKPLSYSAFKHVQQNADFYRAVLNAGGSVRLITHLLDFMAQTSYEWHAPIREVAPKMTVEPMLIAHFLAGALFNTLRWWLANDCQPSPETMAYTFSQLAAPGTLDAVGLG
ncbi:MAG: TetR/AcrR family transcriptional regulator [Anaerolineae bacterium]|jgi:AcrR family transcriptional regulator|nr:TetR/AcrR family transcriptional regulator [Anaerolineae bacterium]